MNHVLCSRQGFASGASAREMREVFPLSRTRLRWLCTLCESTGLRAAELIAARRSHVHVTRCGALLEVLGKGVGRERFRCRGERFRRRGSTSRREGSTSTARCPKPLCWPRFGTRTRRSPTRLYRPSSWIHSPIAAQAGRVGFARIFAVRPSRHRSGLGCMRATCNGFSRRHTSPGTRSSLRPCSVSSPLILLTSQCRP